MKNNIYLTLLFVGIFYSCAVSVRDSESNYQESDFPTTSEINLIEEFEEDDLDEKSIEAFEKRSLEMAKDFAELMDIIHNKSIDTALRDNAIRQLNALFVNEAPLILVDGEKVEQLPVMATNLTFIPEKPFVKTEEGYYYNELKSVDQNTNLYIRSILRKRKKTFGQESKMVWEVFLQQVNILHL